MPPTCGLSFLGILVVSRLNSLSRGIELHAEHLAVHATSLWRRNRESRLVRKESHIEIGAQAQQFTNVTTALAHTKTEYVGVIGVGTAHDGKSPQFEARVVFDTGSTNLWVASVLCKSSPCTAEKAKHFYDPEQSITQEFFGKEGSQDLKVVFGSGELQGPIHIDSYRVGPMVVQRQPFGMIREMKGAVFDGKDLDGILGLGFKSMSFGGIQPFFDRVIEQKLLMHNEFAFYINVDRSQASALLWGGVDRDLFDGPIRMFPVIQEHYWAVELLDFRVGNTSLLTSKAGSQTVDHVIFDTGTQFFTAPSDLHSALLSRFPRAPCEQAKSYPPLTYVLRGSDGDTFDLEISPSTYLVAAHGLCRLAFSNIEMPASFGPAMMLGEHFMRHFFTVFSRGDGSPGAARVGVAPARLGAAPKVQQSQGSQVSFLQMG